ncbi:hypothetical protein [Oceanobacillus neutriphilus]|uniref:ABC-2 type transport system permease protein n=1 Tax=Oceanobacillus neutriphilus TaxID=531815 RepID=A0ABQ2P322_9BACI|nr:hypothetical protein [Oceanobacillus neutriphilus]GGP16832.1 hypothetical protein GCM10011346_50370 [Oceanobacillus neutriphilus]
MNNLKSLFLFRLKNQTQLSNLESSNKEVRKHAIYTISGYIAAFLMFLGYVVFIAIDLNVNNNIQAFFVLLTSILFWVFGIWNILSGFDDVIEGKDSEFIYSLPIKNWQAKLFYLLSKYLVHMVLTLTVLIFGSILVIPLAGHFLSVILMVILLSFIIPLVSTNLTFIISMLVRNILILVRLRNNVTESIITLGIFVTPLIYLIINSGAIGYKDWFINASILRYPLNEINSFPFLLNMLLLIAATLISTFLVIYIMNSFHDFLRNQINNRKKKRQENAAFKIKSPEIGLLLKEFKLYFSSLTYVNNTILTPAGIVIVNICILTGIIPGINSFSYDLLGYTITAQHIYTLIAFTSVILTTTTSCSISFEGRSVWIMLTAPVNVKKIAFGKILINVLLFVPGIILTAIVFYTVFHVSMLYLITITVLLVSTLFLISVIGFLVNLYFPSYNWSSDMEVVKQSKGTIVTAVISMITIPIIITSVFIDNLFLMLLIVMIEIAAIIMMVKKISKGSMVLE